MSGLTDSRISLQVMATGGVVPTSEIIRLMNKIETGVNGLISKMAGNPWSDPAIQQIISNSALGVGVIYGTGPINSVPYFSGATQLSGTGILYDIPVVGISRFSAGNNLVWTDRVPGNSGSVRYFRSAEWQFLQDADNLISGHTGAYLWVYPDGTIDLTTGGRDSPQDGGHFYIDLKNQGHGYIDIKPTAGFWDIGSAGNHCMRFRWTDATHCEAYMMGNFQINMNSKKIVNLPDPSGLDNTQPLTYGYWNSRRSKFYDPVISISSTPPSPIAGRYLIDPLVVASGDWSGHEGEIADGSTGSWVYTGPVTEYILKLESDGHWYRFGANYVGETIDHGAAPSIETFNASSGDAVLVGGTVTVNTGLITGISRVLVTSQIDGGVPGFLRVTARTAGTSFTITSSNALDTSTVSWLIVEP